MNPNDLKCRAKRLDNGEVVEGYPIPVEAFDYGLLLQVNEFGLVNASVMIDPATLQLCSEAELRIKPKEFRDFWNKYSDLPEIHVMTGKRNRQLQTRSKEPAFVDGWKIAVNKMAKSPFLTGKEANWHADVTWFLENDNNYIKVLEGKYDKQKQPVQQTQSLSALERARMKG